MRQVLLLATLGLASAFSPEALKDEVTNLPGAPANLPFRQFAGYMQVSSSGKNIFYWHVTAEQDAANAPVVLWTNGGPGCSGLGGFMTENGPFRPSASGSLALNPTAWNTVANMVFVEQPVGVGFSYAENSRDYTIGDFGAAMDNYHFLEAFMKKFPQYANNDLYITSESYGGHYMPTLAQRIVQSGGLPNFKGFLVGNPYTDPVENAIGMFGTWYGHSLVAKPTFDDWYKFCINPGGTDRECDRAQNQLNKQAGDLDPYALDYDVCLDSAQAAGRHERHTLLNAMHKAGVHNMTHHETVSSGYQPCEANFATTYLSRPDVQQAIHAKPLHRWNECGGKVRYNETDLNTPMEPIWQDLIQRGNLRMAIMSGDDDSVCGSLGTQHWMYDNKWGFKVRDAWTPWTDGAGQVGGYLTKFDGFSFITVHGAGHMCPSTRPERTLEVFKMYLNGTLNA